MAVTKVKTWVTDEVLSTTDLNAESDNIYNNQGSLGWPRTAAASLAGQALTLDSGGNSDLQASTNNLLDLQLNSASGLFSWDGTASTPINGMDWIAGASGTDVQISANSTGSNASINVVPKGTGQVKISGNHMVLVEDNVIAARVFA